MFKRILVVDDNVDLAQGLALLLRCWGHEVHTAYDGPSALDVARGLRLDVLLLDIGLPGLNGFELAAALRREGRSALRILGMSGMLRASDAREATEAGIDHHLLKPVDVRFLRSLLGDRLAGAGNLSP